MKTKTKPTFEERIGLTTMHVKDVDGSQLTFNAQRQGPTNWINLRNADYGSNFTMPTAPRIVPLIYSAVMNREREDLQTASQVVQALKDYWITGNTGLLWTQKGLYAQDNPKVANGRIQMDEAQLEKALAKNDKSVRFTPYGFKTGELSSHTKLATHPEVITIFGGEEQAEQIAEVSSEHKLKPYVYGFSEPVEHPEIRVPDVGSGGFDGRLGVDGYYFEYGDYRCSFGVSK